MQSSGRIDVPLVLSGAPFWQMILITFWLCNLMGDNSILWIYLFGWFMVFNATFNNISVISWQSVLLVEETRVPWDDVIPLVVSGALSIILQMQGKITLHLQVGSHVDSLFFPYVKNIMGYFNILMSKHDQTKLKLSREINFYKEMWLTRWRTSFHKKRNTLVDIGFKKWTFFWHTWDFESIQLNCLLHYRNNFAEIGKIIKFKRKKENKKYTDFYQSIIQYENSVNPLNMPTITRHIILYNWYFTQIGGHKVKFIKELIIICPIFQGLIWLIIINLYQRSDKHLWDWVIHI